MIHLLRGLVVLALLVGSHVVWASGEHEHAHEASAPAGDTLTGEVVDVFCYLSHGDTGLGKGHAECARKCIKNGLPVAIKVGDQLYLASLQEHEPANETLAKFAGQQVTVRGEVMERDGQRFIAVSHVEPAGE